MDYYEEMVKWQEKAIELDQQLITFKAFLDMLEPLVLYRNEPKTIGDLIKQQMNREKPYAERIEAVLAAVKTYNLVLGEPTDE